MFKKIVPLFLFILMLLSPSGSVQSQGTNFPSPTVMVDDSTGAIQEVGIRFSCLKADICQGDTECSTQNTSRVKITADTDTRALPSDKKAYLMECVEFQTPTEEGLSNICTTGNSTLDKELFCNDPQSTDPQCDRVTMLKEKLGYSLATDDQEVGVFYKNSDDRFIRRTPPTYVETNSQGKIIPDEIEWQNTANLRGITRRFMIVNKFKLDKVAQGGLGGQQQNDLSTASQSSSCTGVKYDPYGRAFDMVSLEPIPDVSVRLDQLDTKTGVFSAAVATAMNPGILNPYLTLASGMFTFYVVDGDYKLLPTHAEYTHQKKAEAAEFVTNSKNIARIYSNLYFSDSEPIQQRGAIQQRDIPLKPKNPHGNTYPLTILSELEEIRGNGSINTEIVYSGAVSHPFAELQVSICSDITGEEVCRNTKIYTKADGGPDKNGAFKITLNQSELQIENGEYFKKTFMPTNLTAANIPLTKTIVDPIISYIRNLFSITVSAAESSRSVTTRTYPIPTYVEGYAYDSQGNIIPRALVEVYVDSLDFVSFRTQTNENGYFKITTDNLPTVEYSLRYAPPSNKFGSTTITTSQFLAQNHDFIEQEKVNPYMYATASTDPRATVTPSYLPNKKNIVISQPSPTVSSTPTVTPPPTERAESPLFMIVALVISLILLGGVGIYWFTKRISKPQF